MDFRTRDGHRLPDTETSVHGGGRVSRARPNWLNKLAMVACVAAASLAGWAFATNYVYDANGRLVGVTNDAGDSARCLYDELGNLADVQRLAAGDLEVLGVSPSRGATGVQVTVQGREFNPTAADNAVTFNGAPAVVSVATTNKLITTVPAGATTGPIAVSVGASTVMSPTTRGPIKAPRFSDALADWRRGSRSRIYPGVSGLRQAAY